MSSRIFARKKSPYFYLFYFILSFSSAFPTRYKYQVLKYDSVTRCSFIKGGVPSSYHLVNKVLQKVFFCQINYFLQKFTSKELMMEWNLKTIFIENNLPKAAALGSCSPCQFNSKASSLLGRPPRYLDSLDVVYEPNSLLLSAKYSQQEDLASIQSRKPVCNIIIHNAQNLIRIDDKFRVFIRECILTNSCFNVKRFLKNCIYIKEYQIVLILSSQFEIYLKSNNQHNKSLGLHKNMAPAKGVQPDHSTCKGCATRTWHLQRVCN